MVNSFYSKVIKDLAQAIAHAEGFGVPGAVPTRAHNPGDLKIPNWKGPITGNENISVFSDDETGWERLYHQLDLIVTKKSHVYNLKMTFIDFANKWTTTEQSFWLDNVMLKLRNLGYIINKNTTLKEYFSEPFFETIEKNEEKKENE